MELLTKSRLSAVRTCPRLEQFTYQLGYRPVRDADELRFGSAAGNGLDLIWACRVVEVCTLFPQMDPGDVARLRPMLAGYIARWADEDEQRYEVLAIEKEFRCPLVNPDTGRPSRTWELAGKFDKLVRERSTGRVYVVEHKTSSKDITPGSAYWARLRMDTQVSVYWTGAKSLGLDLYGVLYDVLGKPKLRPLEATPPDKRKYRKDDGKLYAGQRDTDESLEEFELRVAEAIAEAPEAYFQRCEVVRLEDELKDAMRGIWQRAELMNFARRREHSEPNPDACERWGKLCAFFDVCSGAASIDDPARFTKLSNVHPELEETIASAG